MFAKFEATPEQICRAREMYDEAAKYETIAEFLNTSETTVRKYARVWGWPERTPTRGALSPEKITPVGRRTEPQGTRELSRRVEAAVRTELSAIERRLGASSAASAERNARVLGSLVKSLAELRKLDREDSEARNFNAGSGSDDEGSSMPPADMARLRQELADNLARIQSQQDAARSDSET